MSNIILIGFSQSGKTTVGKILAEKMQQPFIELENELEKEYQKSINTLIQENGINEFRKIEKAAIEKLMSKKNKVITIRSDAVVDEASEEISKLLPNIGTVVYLQTDKQELLHRLEENQNIAELSLMEFKQDNFSEQIAKKEPLYFQISSIIIQTTGKTPEEIADEILLLI